MTYGIAPIPIQPPLTRRSKRDHEPRRPRLGQSDDFSMTPEFSSDDLLVRNASSYHRPTCCQRGVVVFEGAEVQDQRSCKPFLSSAGSDDPQPLSCTSKRGPSGKKGNQDNSVPRVPQANRRPLQLWHDIAHSCVDQVSSNEDRRGYQPNKTDDPCHRCEERRCSVKPSNVEPNSDVRPRRVLSVDGCAAEARARRADRPRRDAALCEPPEGGRQPDNEHQRKRSDAQCPG